MTGRGLVNPGPPVFGPEGRRWSLGSRVRAHWWSDKPMVSHWWAAKPQGHSDGTYIERSSVGLVTGIRAGGPDALPDAWVITISFGPLWDSMIPTEFTPSQISFLEAG